MNDAITAAPEQAEENKLWLTLGLLDEQVRRARERVAVLEGEARRAAGAAERATAALSAYFEAVSVGERPPDGAVESELRATAREAQDRLSIRQTSPAAGEPRVFMVDVQVEAELAGARRALEQAELSLHRFLVVNLDGLAGERWPSTVAARDRFNAAWAETRAAEAEWLDELRLWERLRPVAGVDLAEVPASPLRGVDRAIEGGVALPMPPSLVPEEAGSS